MHRFNTHYMKKIILGVLLAGSLISCGDDDKPVDPVKQDETKTLLVGKWNMVKAEYYQNGQLVESEDLKSGSCDYDYYDLKTGGTKDEIYHDAEADCATENYPGTWTYESKGKTVTIVDAEDDYTIEAGIESINASDLKIKMISSGGQPAPEGIEVFLYLKK